VEYVPRMETVHVVLDSDLRIALDEAARRRQVNRSQLMREALREYLQRLEIKLREERDREGYRKNPPMRDGAQDWESQASWPEL